MCGLTRNDTEGEAYHKKPCSHISLPVSRCLLLLCECIDGQAFEVTIQLCVKELANCRIY